MAMSAMKYGNVGDRCSNVSNEGVAMSAMKYSNVGDEGVAMSVMRVLQCR